MRRPLTHLVFLPLLLLACSDDDANANTDPGDGEAGSDDTHATHDTHESSESGETQGDHGDPAVEPYSRTVLVLVDGEPTEGVVVLQGGASTQYLTGADGRVEVEVDTSVEGEWTLHGSHPEARIGFVPAGPESSEDLTIELVRYMKGDNEEYEFYIPGEPLPPGTDSDPEGCAHCHRTMNQDWFDSPHRSSASNVTVQDLYAGTAAAVATPADCEAAGGNWWAGLEPGTGDAAERCYLGTGTLPALNANCGTTGSCDESATNFGGCADCHAPAINGQLGGRSLLEARGDEYEYGVHCDLCHKVSELDLEAPPGVGGRLIIERPYETRLSGLHAWINFGPFHDVGHPRMGAVYRDFYTEAEFCAGCHQHDAPVEVAVGTIDEGRWVEGVLPIQTTYQEWQDGPMNPGSPCVTCHMPPDLEVANAADLQHYLNLDIGITPGVSEGWHRPLGDTREHSWVGPRNVDSGMLQLAAQVEIDKSVMDDELVAEVRVRNTGAGHAIPTGEPMRNMVLFVEASCDGTSLTPLEGPSVPGFGGALDGKALGEDWNSWPGAEVGQVVRVVSRPGTYYDYVGTGPFGDGNFSPEQKGMLVERFVGQSTITAVNGDTVTFDAPLPMGDHAYLGETVGDPSQARGAGMHAGALGFGFAKVLQGAGGEHMVPHFAATDVRSDNRILPQQAWGDTYRFATSCADPLVRAVLVYRPYEIHLARERQWTNTQSVMVDKWQ
jgi:hypothetical protein